MSKSGAMAAIKPTVIGTQKSDCETAGADAWPRVCRPSEQQRNSGRGAKSVEGRIHIVGIRQSQGGLHFRAQRGRCHQFYPAEQTLPRRSARGTPADQPKLAGGGCFVVRIPVNKSSKRSPVIADELRIALKRCPAGIIQIGSGLADAVIRAKVDGAAYCRGSSLRSLTSLNRLQSAAPSTA